MIKLLLALVLALCPTLAGAQSAPPSLQLCNRVTTGNSTTQIATASAGRTIWICGYAVQAIGNTAGFAFGYGTGANCATGQTAISPVFSGLPQGAMIVDHPNSAYTSLPVDQNLCVVSAGNVVWAIYWGQY